MNDSWKDDRVEVVPGLWVRRGRIVSVRFRSKRWVQVKYGTLENAWYRFKSRREARSWLIVRKIIPRVL